MTLSPVFFGGWLLLQTTLNATWMEDAYDALAERAIKNMKSGTSKDARYIIGVAGPPGSGKSTLAREVCHLINLKSDSEIAINVPMDGFHYYKRELDQMPNPAEAYARRGAHWTFDAMAFVRCLKEVKFGVGKTFSAPSFDHGVGDPKPDAIKVLPQHKIVISEGNYLLVDLEPWSQLWQEEETELPVILDDTWYVDCELDVAMHRVFKRQIGNGVDAKVSRGRIERNDRPNAQLIEGTKSKSMLVVPSLPFKQPH
jgi:pantothenate kinase